MGEELEKGGLFMRITHAKWTGLFNDDLHRMIHHFPIIRTVLDDVLQILIWEFCIEQVECCVSYMENKGLVGIRKVARGRLTSWDLRESA